MKALSNLISSLWIMVLLGMFSVPLPLRAAAPAAPLTAYNGQVQLNDAYDGLSQSASDCEYAPSLAANENESQTARTIGAFTRRGEFLAAKTEGLAYRAINSQFAESTTQTASRSGVP